MSPTTNIHDEVLWPARLAALDSYDILDTAPEQGFDDVVRLASRLCATPVALVSLVAVDRQWFKARVGFPPCETDLDSSVCKFALVEPDLLVIPDLAADPRTRANPLVTHEPHIRFYAGAPLRVASGEVFGSLCVIDTVTRPGGLTPEQADDLRALGRQVTELLELRRAIAARTALLTERQTVERERETLVATQARIAAAAGALDATLDAVVSGALQAVRAAQGAVVELIDGDDLEYRAVAGDLVPHRGLRVPLDDSLAGTCARSGTAILAEDVLADGQVKPALVELLRMRAALLAPIYRAGEVVGVLKLQAARPGVFTERDLALAQLFAAAATSGLTEVAEADAQRAKHASDARWRMLFEQLTEGFILGEVVRDATGHIVDWRCLEVNRAWGELVGLSSEEAAGRTIREILPDIEDAWIDDFAGVVDTGRSATFTRQVGMQDRWYEGRAHKVGPDTFALLFLEVTERVRRDRSLAASDARKSALVELGDRLRETSDAEHMAYTAAEILGRTLGAIRTGYGAVDVARDSIVVARDWRAPGVDSVSGLHHFRDYGTYIEDLRRGQTVLLSDVASDLRTRDRANALRALGIGAMINMPLIEHGTLVALLFIHHDQPRTWTDEDVAFVRSVADRTRASIARVRAEEQQSILNGELSHRLKNTLTMVLSIATQTLRSVPDQEPVEAFERRIFALASAHDVLMQASWTAAPIGSVAQAVLGNFDSAGRLKLSGPEISLGPRATLSLSLLLHELATNAAKYGALSTEGGHVDVAWRLDGQVPDPDMILDWREAGGPPVRPPTSRGFGSRLIKMGLVGNGQVELDYPPSGFKAEMRAPLTQLQQS